MLQPLNLAPPFNAMVTNAYLFGNGGATALTAASSLSIFVVIVFSYVQPAFGVPYTLIFNPASSAFQVVAKALEISFDSIDFFDVAFASLGPAAIILTGVLIAVQGILTIIHNNEVINAVNQAVTDANQPYNVSMLISAIQSNSTTAISEFITVFSVAATGQSTVSVASTTVAVSLLVNDLCNFAGPFDYNNTQLCPFTTITQANIQAAVVAWLYNATAATSIYGHISNWDTSQVYNMSHLFEAAATFNDDISLWETSKVRKIFSAAFDRASLVIGCSHF